MLSYSKLKSHPSKSLEEHLLNVACNCESFCKNLSINDKNLYTQISFFIGLCHDFAKSTTFFQEYLNDGKKSQLKNHGFLSAVFGYYVVKNYLSKNNISFDLDLSSLTYLVILRHHGDFKNISGTSGELNKVSLNHDLGEKQVENIKNNIKNNNGYDLRKFYETYDINLNDFINSYNDILDEIEESLDDIIFDENIENYFTLILLYSMLIDSDKIDASQTELFKRPNIPSDIVDLYKMKKFGLKSEGINCIREKAYHEINQKVPILDLNKHIYSIDLPTGSGKTLAAFNFALKLKKRIQEEKNFNPRIIYSLPFLSIIDQNEKVIRDVLHTDGIKDTNALLKHNYLSDMKYTTESNHNKELNLNNVRILIEGWNSEIIVTTFIQFFYSLISNKNRSLRKFHNMVNSIIILDEIQAVPFKYWNILNICLKKLAYEFNCWIILMTATQPLIFSEENGEILPLISKDEYFTVFNRVNYNFNLEDMSLDDFKDFIIDEIVNNPEKDIMIVLNTIQSSKDVYTYIKERFEDQYENIIVDTVNGIVNISDTINLVYLSTNIIPKHRLSRINELKKEGKRKIIITTQLIEAGVDISVDIIYRDLAPIDSIIQTAGRCNRNNEKTKGEVNVISLINDKGRKFSRMVYDSILLSSTIDLLKKQESCSEKEFNLITSQEYNKILLKNGSQDKNLLKIIKELNLGKISSDFKLIEETVEKIDVFVNFDEESQLLWEKFNDMEKCENNFKKKELFLKIKAEFYNYIISISSKKFGSTNICNDWLGFIAPEDIARKYDIETGFIFEDDEEAFII
ncbi:CRISPR-associated helicase Cas3' [Methanobrevibacter sp. UBA313]|uniref:CRISPR-associated helicase Cas3' n=1 Tax=Methanobrevibacter sp. UBA313 TaxID=1915477 RepID=UPI0039B88BDC